MNGIGVYFNMLWFWEWKLIVWFMILIMLDGECIMNIYFGVCMEFGLIDVDEDVVVVVVVIYMEGYFWDFEEVKKVFIVVVEIVYKYDCKVVIILLDFFCVDCYWDEFQGLLVNNMVDLMFVNEYEFWVFYQIVDFDIVINVVCDSGVMIVLIFGKEGVMVIICDEIVKVLV